jgi:hypothetical protein|tara:strand:- start:502 stop:714 length:213 start_codon:yes stop_codon:yes gene_type:complete
MYTVTNFKSKAALKRAVAAGEQVETYQPGGLFPAETEGKIYLEGPHNPAMHTWYASAQVKDGIIIKGTVK